MHSLFTESRLLTICEQRKSAHLIKAILISRSRIIHNFVRIKTAAVNKFFWLR
jgi:hypothetical protein